MERKIHDARAFRVRDVKDKHEIGGRCIVFTEETNARFPEQRAEAQLLRLFISAEKALLLRIERERERERDRARYRRE